MSNVLKTVDEVKALIESGKSLLLAGDENLLRQLPTGNWIGGTIPYFIAEEGGVLSQEKILVKEVPEYATSAQPKTYQEAELGSVYQDIPGHGFGVIIIAGLSNSHLSFALNAPNYEHFAVHPLIGWIAGIHLDDLGKVTPKVFNGQTGEVSDDAAVAMHIGLPDGKAADLEIVNIFEQGDGDTITVIENGFSHSEAMINGEKRNLADYVAEKEIDIRLPLVANYAGTSVNVSFQAVDEEAKRVDFYAPLFTGVEYKVAAPVGDYVMEFTSRVPKVNGDEIAFSCNCILNWLYGELEGRKTGEFTGPATFGEVAYQLVNQTMVLLKVTESA